MYFYVLILYLYISGCWCLVREGNKFYWIFQEFKFLIPYISGKEGAKRIEHMAMKNNEEESRIVVAVMCVDREGRWIASTHGTTGSVTLIYRERWRSIARLPPFLRPKIDITDGFENCYLTCGQIDCQSRFFQVFVATQHNCKYAAFMPVSYAGEFSDTVSKFILVYSTANWQREWLKIIWMK